jgi:hypothetical protein
MTVRAQFRVKTVTHNEHGGSVKLIMATPPRETSAENAFAKQTQWGTIELSVYDKTALESFQPGAEFHVDFTPLEAEALRRMENPGKWEKK